MNRGSRVFRPSETRCRRGQTGRAAGQILLKWSPVASFWSKRGLFLKGLKTFKLFLWTVGNWVCWGKSWLGCRTALLSDFRLRPHSFWWPYSWGSVMAGWLSVDSPLCWSFSRDSFMEKTSLTQSHPSSPSTSSSSSNQSKPFSHSGSNCLYLRTPSPKT